MFTVLILIVVEKLGYSLKNVRRFWFPWDRRKVGGEVLLLASSAPYICFTYRPVYGVDFLDLILA